METSCYFCEGHGARYNLNHWNGVEYVRIDACFDCHRVKDLVKRAPRKPRTPKPATAQYGDGAYLTMMARAASKRGAA